MPLRARLADYWSMTKPDVNLLIGITTATGFCLGRPPHEDGFPFLQLAHTVVGTLSVAGGTGTLNQWMERRFDALMRRTARRPVAGGRITPSSALAFGVLLCAGGVVYLAAAVNALSAVIALLTMASYLFVYTPLKRRTPFCTVAGAIQRDGASPAVRVDRLSSADLRAHGSRSSLTMAEDSITILHGDEHETVPVSARRCSRLPRG